MEQNGKLTDEKLMEMAEEYAKTIYVENGNDLNDFEVETEWKALAFNCFCFVKTLQENYRIEPKNNF